MLRCMSPVSVRLGRVEYNYFGGLCYTKHCVVIVDCIKFSMPGLGSVW